jgi:hypothetical protein
MTDQQALREKTVARVRYYFDELLTPDPDGMSRSEHREKVHGEISVLFDRCARAAITPRLLASWSGISGHLLLQFITNPQRRAEAFNAEIYHLERELRHVKSMKESAAVAEVDSTAGWSREELSRLRMRKVDIAQRWEVSRPTLDAWIAAADERRRGEFHPS